MSKFHLSNELTQLITNAVHAFASRIEKEHKISKDQVIHIWEQCSLDITTKSSAPAAATAKKVKKVSDAEKKKTELSHVQKLVKAEVPERRFALRKNEYGEYEHKETGFCFDPQTKEVKGKQVGDTLKKLTLSDIEVCKQYGFKYQIPESFDEEVVEIEAEVSDIEDLDGSDEDD